jgi:hypothetical protein
MRKNFRMSTRAIDEQGNNLKFGPKMLSMSGVSFRAFDKSKFVADLSKGE